MATSFDVPIVLIFFNRPDTLVEVFAKIREIKPQLLFLVQDGPRNDEDMKKIMACREIVEEIDWPCDTRKNYATRNLGCGERPFSGISWAFETVDQAIILEDDCVPDISFFAYCKALLERYQDDTRISYISGLNHFEDWVCGGNSYFFAKTGAIWGWATWKKEWVLSDYRVRQVQNPYYRRLVAEQFSSRKEARKRVNIWEKIASMREEKLSYWDIQWGFAKYSQNKLVAVPKHNLIRNIGAGESSTHAKSVFHGARRRRKTFFFIPTKPLDFPLTHPECMLCDVMYDKRVYRCGNPSLPVAIMRKIIHVLACKLIKQR